MDTSIFPFRKDCALLWIKCFKVASVSIQSYVVLVLDLDYPSDWLKQCIGCRYQIAVLELLAQSTYEGHTINWSKHLNESMKCQFLEIHRPSVLDLSEDTEYASQAALWGIEVCVWLCFSFEHEGCSTGYFGNSDCFLVGFTRFRWNVSSRRFCGQAWFSWHWHRWMSSCCYASLLWTDIIGGSYKRSSGMRSMLLELDSFVQRDELLSTFYIFVLKWK